jgi:hypothetical protein
MTGQRGAVSQGFYVHVTDRTPEQVILTERTYEAAKILREHGIPCDVREFCAFEPTSSPAAIFLDPRAVRP